jgi:DNA-binding CsgD family transcriptional regulator
MTKTGKGPRAITGAKSIRDSERRAEILRYRLDGHTLQEIGDRMGIRADTVHVIITRALRAMTQDPSQELLTLELARLDSLYAEALKAVRSFTPVLHNGRVVQIPIIDTNGETIKHPETGQPLICIAQDRQPVLAGIACAVRIAERRSKLLGLDAPIRAQQEVTVTGSGQPDIGHLSVEDLESIKQKLYGGQRLLATTPAEGETEQ